MTTRCTDPQMNDLLGSYLLGACPDAEADAMRAHLVVCDACACEAGELVMARDALLSIPADVPAPAALKERVMTQVRADAQLFAAAQGRQADAPARAGRGRAPRFAWLRSPLPMAAAAACALALVVGGALLGSSLGGDGDSRAVRTELGAVDGTRAPGGRAKVVFDSSGGARLVVNGLPSPGRERVYQVWLRKGDGAPVPTPALFSVAEDGSGEAVVPGDVGKADQVLVTSEPDGGSRAPTRPALVTVDV